MSPDRVREILEQRPFEPITIHTGDGSEVTVPSPEFAYLYPGGRTLLVVEGIDEGKLTSREHRIDVFLITNVTNPPKRNGREKPKRR